MSARAERPGMFARALSLHCMSERADACRRKARECELASRLAIDVDMRIMYRDLARLWQEIASELEQHDQSLSVDRAK
jgi:hypothetical protein